MVMDKQDNLDAQPLFIVRYKDELQYYKDIFAVYQFHTQPNTVRLVLIIAIVLVPIMSFFYGARGAEILYITVLTMGIIWLVFCTGGKKRAWKRAMSAAKRLGENSYNRRRNICPEEVTVELKFYDDCIIEETVNEKVTYTYERVKAILYYEDMIVLQLGERLWERLIFGIPLQGLLQTDREVFLSFINAQCINTKKGIQRLQ